jgi:hypothetical protein
MDSSVALDLPDLKVQLDAWRATHRQRARIPEHFYASALTLLDRYSISVICRETRLRPASLRKHAAPPQAVETPITAPSTSFLHLTASDLAVPPHAVTPARSPVPAVDSSSRLIFERADGSRLSLHLPTADPSHLEALCLSLLRS